MIQASLSPWLLLLAPQAHGAGGILAARSAMLLLYQVGARMHYHRTSGLSGLPQSKRFLRSLCWIISTEGLVVPAESRRANPDTLS
jgi:hypothetical protein